MIIICPECKKKFELEASLIPSEGRELQCGSCNHIWLYKNEDKNFKNIAEDKKDIEIFEAAIGTKVDSKSSLDLEVKNKANNKNIKKTIVKSIKKDIKNKSTFSTILSYLIVLIISFVGLVIILDTFKIILSDFFPNLEFLLFSLFETLKDILLFLKNLFK